MKHISRVEEAYPGWMIRSWQKQRAEANKDKEPRVMKDRDLTDTVIKFKKEIIQGQPNYYYKTSEGPKASKVTMNYLANKANAHLGIDTSNPRGNYSYLTLNQQEYDTLSKAIEANGGKVSLIESAETRIKTPRGLIRVSDKSESELNKEGYGYWFSTEVDGVSYRVLNNGTYAVAVKKLSEGFENNYSQLVVYNGSNTSVNYSQSDINNSRELGIHCGTIEAAKARGYKVINKIVIDAAHAYSYYIDKDFTDMWASPALVDFIPGLSKESRNNLRDELRKCAGNSNKYQCYSKILRDAFLDAGYNLIEYTNEVEDRGSRSYIILDTSIILSQEEVDNLKESVHNDILPKRVRNAILTVNTYADYEKEGFNKEDVDDWFGTNGNLKATYSYETADDESGSMIGVETTDGKYAVYGARQDEEDITFEHMAEVLVSEASSLGDIKESFSKTAYDANTLAMLELKVPEEVLNQKEELNTCKEFKDERVKSQPIKKVKDIKAMKLDDKSVTDAQKVNDGKVSELKSKK